MKNILYGTGAMREREKSTINKINRNNMKYFSVLPLLYPESSFIAQINNTTQAITVAPRKKFNKKIILAFFFSLAIIDGRKYMPNATINAIR
jgi:hypothetical protein